MSLVSRFSGALSSFWSPLPLLGPEPDPEATVTVVGDVLFAGMTVNGRLLLAFRTDVGLFRLASCVARRRAFALSRLISMRLICSGVNCTSCLDDEAVGGGV